MRRRLLLVVNPVAGLGGPLGLKGTDEDVGRRLLLSLRSEPPAYIRARRFLASLQRLCGDEVVVLTARRLGYELAREAGLSVNLVYEPTVWPTRSIDTFNAVVKGLAHNPDLIVFVGGDGTARLVYDAMRASGVEDKPMLGVPAGVKMYSGVYAVRPEEGAQLACRYLRGEAGTCEAEIMDIDEDAFREGRLVARLYGVARVPCGPELVGVSKQPSPASGEEEENKEAIARYVLEEYVKPCTLLILGPGTTTAAIARLMGVPKTLLGVDVYHDRRPVALDVDEAELYKLVSSHPGRKLIVLTPIGGQGFILGRGNQQVSPRVVRVVGPENIIVVATRSKLRSLGGRLRVDTGDPELDALLRGYRRVIIDYGEEAVVRVE